MYILNLDEKDIYIRVRDLLVDTYEIACSHTLLSDEYSECNCFDDILNEIYDEIITILDNARKQKKCEYFIFNTLCKKCNPMSLSPRCSKVSKCRQSLDSAAFSAVGRTGEDVKDAIIDLMFDFFIETLLSSHPEVYSFAHKKFPFFATNPDCLCENVNVLRNNHGLYINTGINLPIRENLLRIAETSSHEKFENRVKKHVLASMLNYELRCIHHNSASQCSQGMYLVSNSYGYTKCKDILMEDLTISVLDYFDSIKEFVKTSELNEDRARFKFFQKLLPCRPLSVCISQDKTECMETMLLSMSSMKSLVSFIVDLALHKNELVCLNKPYIRKYSPVKSHSELLPCRKYSYGGTILNPKIAQAATDKAQTKPRETQTKIYDYTNYFDRSYYSHPYTPRSKKAHLFKGVINFQGGEKKINNT